MKGTLMAVLGSALWLMASCASSGEKAEQDNFVYQDERFADIEMLRYRVDNFDSLSLRQKTLIYHLQEAALWGRDILFDQNCRYNLRIRRALEAVYIGREAMTANLEAQFGAERAQKEMEALEEYLKRTWFSAGIHHHYGREKFKAGFSADFFRAALEQVPDSLLPLTSDKGEACSLETFCTEVFPVIFDDSLMAQRVNQRDGDDLLLTSACNYYESGITQEEAEAFYAARKDTADLTPIMHGLNSRLVRDKNGKLMENICRVGGLYTQAIEHIVAHLEAALPFAENDAQKATIDHLIEYYRTGDLKTFDEYTILWLKDTLSEVDFTNGFTETYGDPLGMKASWEALVNFKDLAATKRTEKLADNAQWFENNSPIDPRFRKEKVRGVSAKVITAAILGGDLYPSTAIGINLPNSDWVRAAHGSKSVSLQNIVHAYNSAARGSGMSAEFVIDDATRALIEKYGDLTGDLHTDLHECLGHASGRLDEGTDPDALKAYGSTIEEARADLFALYYLADDKLVELGLTPDKEAYKSEYYTYMQNGLLTQLVRITLGNTIEEAHMRNRALIAHWALAHADKDNPCVELIKRDGKTYVQINDYEALRILFGNLLAEIQRVKSEGDYEGARNLVETYGVNIDSELHKEILNRYEALHLQPYKGFINPVYTAIYDNEGNIVDVTVGYDEGYAEQMLRYSRDYSPLPNVN